MLPTPEQATPSAVLPAAVRAPRPPNVLFVTIDTIRADQLGSYGHPYAKTPTLDSLAAGGARSVNHIVQQPQTDPSHASMFTGMYPSSSGVRVHMVDKLPDNLDTLAKLFSGAGYQTAGLFSFFSFDQQYCNFQPGFDVYRDLTQNQPELSTSRIGTKGRADLTTDAAINQLQGMASEPFFLWLHYFDPHYPYEPPEPYASEFDPDYQGSLNGSIATVDAIESGQLHPQGNDLKRLMSIYQGAIAFVDAQLQRLLTVLEQLNLAGNTIVLATGDHGESFGEHTQLEEGVNFFHPHSLYNTEARVPLLLRYPERLRAGTVMAGPTQAIDVFPTLLELAGLAVPAQSQGQSMLPLLNGQDPGSGRMAFSAMPDYTFTSVTTTAWKLIQNNATGEQALFDLGTDPGEMTDVSSSNGDMQKTLSTALHGWMKTVGIG